MKKLLQSIFGEVFMWRLKDLKAAILPSAGQKLAQQQEAAENELRKKFYSSFVQPGSLCFDVGANMGNRISPMLQIGAKVIAVEPQQACVKYLHYKFGNKITVVPKGAGEKEEIKDFHISSLDVLSSFSDEWINSVKEDRFKHAEWNKTVKVPITTLDKLIAQYGKPAFIKIDVEGYEPQVLKGLTQPVKMLSFEYTFPELTNRAVECIELVEKYNAAIECNFSSGESMELALPQWLTAGQMKTYITTTAFPKNEFGDIYIRSKM